MVVSGEGGSMVEFSIKQEETKSEMGGGYRRGTSVNLTT